MPPELTAPANGLTTHADLALAFEKLSGHERLCAERWQDVHSRVKRIETVMFAGLAALIAGEFGMFKHLAKLLNIGP